MSRTLSPAKSAGSTSSVRSEEYKKALSLLEFQVELGNIISNSDDVEKLDNYINGYYQFINEIDPVSKMSPLTMACRYGRANIARYLIERGADLNLKDRYGRIPLVTACSFEHPNVVKVLIECGVSTIDHQGRLALQRAQHNEKIRALMRKAPQIREDYKKKMGIS